MVHRRLDEALTASFRDRLKGCGHVSWFIRERIHHSVFFFKNCCFSMCLQVPAMIYFTTISNPFLVKFMMCFFQFYCVFFVVVLIIA